jgi:hypothetical protein
VPIADFFGLPGTAAVAKDFHVVRAIQVITAIDASPFSLVFGGGTALARAHRLVRRMSEDVDFKIVPAAAALSRSVLRQRLGDLRERVTAALQAAGFAFDAPDRATRTAIRSTSGLMPASLGQGRGCVRPSRSRLLRRIRI